MKKIIIYICKTYEFDKEAIKNFMASKGYVKYTKKQKDVQIGNAKPNELEPFGKMISFGIETE